MTTKSLSAIYKSRASGEPGKNRHPAMFLHASRVILKNYPKYLACYLKKAFGEGWICWCLTGIEITVTRVQWLASLVLSCPYLSGSLVVVQKGFPISLSFNIFAYNQHKTVGCEGWILMMHRPSPWMLSLSMHLKGSPLVFNLEHLIWVSHSGWAWFTGTLWDYFALTVLDPD